MICIYCHKPIKQTDIPTTIHTLGKREVKYAHTECLKKQEDKTKGGEQI